MESVETIADLGQGFFRLGAPPLAGNLQPNVYLFLDESEALLFGPGPASWYAWLKEGISSCAPRSILRTIVVHGEEPGISSALANWEHEGPIAEIATHWRTWSQIRFYGLTAEPYLVDERGWSLRLASGRVLQFLPTPYLTQPGAFVTYDRASKTLLSGALFSSYSDTPALRADEGTLDRLRRFHSAAMPSREFLSPAIQVLEALEIERILPAYGPILERDLRHLMEELSQLECGELARGASVGGLAAQLAAQGASSEELERLKEENEQLRRLNDELNHSIAVSRDRAIRDTVTGLYSELFYKSFIEEETAIRIGDVGGQDHVLAIFGIDENLAQIEYKYGSREVETLLLGIAHSIEANIPSTAMAFRLHGATMALWLPSIGFQDAIDLFDKIRYGIETSKAFVEPITVSVGVATLAEAADTQPDLEKVAAEMTDLGIRRLRLARRKGGNTVYFSTAEENEMQTLARILVVDDDEVNVDVLKTFLVNQGYAILTAADGQQALALLQTEVVDLVITELMVPKIDAYLLKESMLSKSATKDIPVIVISHLKTELTIRRAYRLGIIHYLQKPIILEELLGIVQNLTLAGNGA